MADIKLDEVGYWSEIKLNIIKEYAHAYSRILERQPKLKHVYVDGFAGAGEHISRRTGEKIKGSPLIALEVEPKFSEYHFIDLSRGKIEYLQRQTAGRKSIHYYREDCNDVLLHKILPAIRYEDYKRALCVLDPYGVHLDWKVVALAGKLGTVDMFIHFSTMDMNMNMLRKDPSKVDEAQIARMNRFWGDESWKDEMYQLDLLGVPDKLPTEYLVRAYRKRLREVAGFRCVPEPIPLRNNQKAIVYYLFFASKQPVAEKIAASIFKKYKNQGLE